MLMMPVFGRTVCCHGLLNFLLKKRFSIPRLCHVRCHTNSVQILSLAFLEGTTGHTKPHIQLVMEVLFPVVKRPVREADHSPPSSAEVKSPWGYTFTLPVRLYGVVLK
jgi:hypothetical protein